MSDYLLGWTNADIEEFRQRLLTWYDENKRPLPWRATKDPYKIWVSEIMSQQTQVGTVIPYYERFIAALPDVQSLAEVDEATLLELWQGLGYYSRARNLKIAANQIVDEFDGIIPNNLPDLLTLRGIGPYTAAAIGSIAFDLVEPALDGNLYRVIARLFEIDADISKQSNRHIFMDILYALIDPQRPGDFNQALMDLGATIMTPTRSMPEESPLVAYDQSYRHQTVENYPVKKSRVKQTVHSMTAYFVYNHQGHWLMRKHGEDELLTGLWHLPLFEQEISLESATEQELIEPIETWLLEQFSDIDIQSLILTTPDNVAITRPLNDYLPAVIRHVFSHRIWNVQIIPVQFNGSLPLDSEGNCWHNLDSFTDLPISTLQSKLFEEIFNWHD